MESSGGAALRTRGRFGWLAVEALEGWNIVPMGETPGLRRFHPRAARPLEVARGADRPLGHPCSAALTQGEQMRGRPGYPIVLGPWVPRGCLSMLTKPRSWHSSLRDPVVRAVGLFLARGLPCRAKRQVAKAEKGPVEGRSYGRPVEKTGRSSVRSQMFYWMI